MYFVTNGIISIVKHLSVFRHNMIYFYYKITMLIKLLYKVRY